jgi:3-oxoacyl-(acyl-carrier-protein) synthase
MIASVGRDREAVWSAVRHGRSNFQFLRGLPGLPDDEFVGATVDLKDVVNKRLKVIPLCEIAAEEALRDAQIDFNDVDRDRFACSISGHMGDSRGAVGVLGNGPPPGDHDIPWWMQAFPNTACSEIGGKYDLRGPRMCHSTACASSLISVVTAARSIRDYQCDIALAGGGDAIDPLFVAGFNKMRVLAKDPDPNRAIRPFDRSRKGFVFGEGGAMLVLERLSHALRRNARIYAEISATKMLSQAHHVTGLDADGSSLDHLIRICLESGGLEPEEVGYINAHGTGTAQNDVAEANGICSALGAAAGNTCVSATKSILGHMIHGAGAAELAITVLAMRDGFVPPTLNLTDPDPACRFDCLPLSGRPHRFQHGLKLSLAFGGHLVAVLLSRWNDATSGFQYPATTKAA